MQRFTGNSPLLSGPEKVSGVPDAHSAGALGKLISACVTGTLRDYPDRFQVMLPQLLNVPPNARVYTERGGTGHEYHTVKYRTTDPATGKTKQKSLYLGRLTDDQKTWMVQILKERAARQAADRTQPIEVDYERIRRLRDMRKRAHAYARIIAKRAGYSWRGYRLLKTRRTA